MMMANLPKVKLISKRLPSGKYQIKFFLEGYYGYLLKDQGTSVKEILEEIHAEYHSFITGNGYFKK